MTSIRTGTFSISPADSTKFARLSGDYNPLHVDPVTARRTRFSGTVVHGIHVYLRALDILASGGVFAGQRPAALSASFDNSVPTGSVVRVDAHLEATKVRLAAKTDDSTAFSGTIELTPYVRETAILADEEFSPERPLDVSFPPVVDNGTVPLRLRRAILAELFPSLSLLGHTSWIGDLLSTTQIVGMRCPGLHSIYTGFRLSHMKRTTSTMSYTLTGTEKRLQLIRMQVDGAYLSGTIDASFRPRPVTQAPAKDISRIVAPRTFSGHRVLIIGGSRGLGELTAKILAVGGADVTITYAQGKADAERLCAELRTVGANCSSQQLAMLVDASAQATPSWLTQSSFSHLYFYASPRIERNTGSWNEALFRHYTQIYIAAFATLIQFTRPARGNHRTPLKVLYPSSVFVTHPEAGFAEYAVAKAAGEALCDQLQDRHALLIHKPRLPRMRTDQTSALATNEVADPLPVMLNVVREFQC